VIAQSQATVDGDQDAMSTDRPKRDTMSLEEATVSNIWEVTAIVVVFERLGRIIEMG
jgi:hypothetical protein